LVGEGVVGLCELLEDAGFVFIVAFWGGGEGGREGGKGEWVEVGTIFWWARLGRRGCCRLR